MKHEEAIKWIKVYSNKIGFQFTELVTVNDIYSDAFILTSENGKSLAYNITRVLWKEKYENIGKAQSGKCVDRDYEKQCNRCKVTKNQAEFDLRYKPEFKMYYLNHICKECRITYNKEFYKRKYATDEEYKRKAIERAHIYRNKPENKVKENQRRAERRLNDPDYKKRRNEYVKQKRKENPEHFRKLARDSYHRNKHKKNANNTTIKKNSL
jgi:hypothetical protein